MRSYSEMYEFTGTVVKVIIGVIIVTGIVLSGVLNKKTIRTNWKIKLISMYIVRVGEKPRMVRLYNTQLI